MAAVIQRFPTLRRHGLIWQTMSDARDGSVTVGELDLVALCRAHGLPIPTRQVVRADAAGRRRFLDASFDPWRVRVEVDGAHHMDVDQWWGDMRRHNDLSAHGETALRFPTWMVREHPADTAATIRRALLAHGWCP